MGKKKPADKALQRTLDSLAWRERMIGECDLKEKFSAAADELRQKLLSAADIYEIVECALHVGAIEHAAFRGHQVRTWKAVTAGRSKGGEGRRIVDPAHVAELEAEANRLRILNPKWKPTRICKAVAQWYGAKHETTPPSEKTIKRELATFFAAKNGQC